MNSVGSKDEIKSKNMTLAIVSLEASEIDDESKASDSNHEGPASIGGNSPGKIFDLIHSKKK